MSILLAFFHLFAAASAAEPDGQPAAFSGRSPGNITTTTAETLGRLTGVIATPPSSSAVQAAWHYRRDPAGNKRTNTYQVQIAATAARSFSYDDDGNLLSDGIRAYEWDSRSRLTKVTWLSGGGFQPPSPTTSFTYNALGQRATRTDSDGTNAPPATISSTASPPWTAAPAPIPALPPSTGATSPKASSGSTVLPEPPTTTAATTSAASAKSSSPTEPSPRVMTSTPTGSGTSNTNPPPTRSEAPAISASPATSPRPVRWRGRPS